MFANYSQHEILSGSLCLPVNKSKLKIKSGNGQTANNDDETCSYVYDSD